MLPLSTPFSSIGLALSGGGFRAAAFSLGMLSYRNRVKLTWDGKGLLTKYRVYTVVFKFYFF
jgi:hypothetical protein